MTVYKKLIDWLWWQVADQTDKFSVLKGRFEKQKKIMKKCDCIRGLNNEPCAVKPCFCLKCHY